MRLTLPRGRWLQAAPRMIADSGRLITSLACQGGIDLAKWQRLPGRVGALVMFSS